MNKKLKSKIKKYSKDNKVQKHINKIISEGGKHSIVLSDGTLVEVASLAQAKAKLADIEKGVSLPHGTVEEVKGLRQMGESVVNIAKYLGIGRDTFYEWLKKSEELTYVFNRSQYDLKLELKDLIYARVLQGKSDRLLEYLAEKLEIFKIENAYGHNTENDIVNFQIVFNNRNKENVEQYDVLTDVTDSDVNDTSVTDKIYKDEL